jgi:hypothetical protein
MNKIKYWPACSFLHRFIQHFNQVGLHLRFAKSNNGSTGVKLFRFDTTNFYYYEHIDNWIFKKYGRYDEFYKIVFFPADIFISYCGKDAPKSRSSVIHPATVCEDLQAVGFKW